MRKHSKLAHVSLFAALFILVIPVFSRADCADPVSRRLGQGAERTRTWANTWGAVWGLATVGQATAAAVSRGSVKTDLWVGAGSSALGLIPTWIVPPRITRYREEDCASPEETERLLDSYAENDRENSGWIAQAGNLAANLGVGLILGLGFGHWSSAAISMAAGIPLGEAMILTYPNAASGLRSGKVALAPVFESQAGGGGLVVSLGF